MLHHYIQRGFKPAYIINLPIAEKLFFKASLELFLEEEIDKINSITNG